MVGHDTPRDPAHARVPNERLGITRSSRVESPDLRAEATRARDEAERSVGSRTDRSGLPSKDVRWTAPGEGSWSGCGEHLVELTG